MGLKYKLLNKLADVLSSYKTPNYDSIQCSYIVGKVKGAINTWDNTYIKELKEKEQSGFISVNDLLDEEIGESKFCDIYFCEIDNIICIYNHSKDSYIETVHECFDPTVEKIYLMCKNKNSYESAKAFVRQSSKYHNFLKIVDELPNKVVFKKLFNNSVESKSSNIDKNNGIEKEEIQKDDFVFENNSAEKDMER